MYKWSSDTHRGTAVVLHDSSLHDQGAQLTNSLKFLMYNVRVSPTTNVFKTLREFLLFGYYYWPEIKVILEICHKKFF